ncbi:hypothetical protein SAMN05444278_10478 [Psychroflexus salarius]|uniref:Lysylphosphatidylglycerol synthase TM region n=1 Tax=Psychroflexus salarius TaxID=1155689 RepID=A0A1M4VIC4_9FLAO|nr:lysylphosphatidylglycerol synthase transmembrane domain-containing protein [Psychroflexus salarius]SHE68764.1 hypothetical protein SAMN05444278_10478 [Psychroflexus salarius]
MQPKLKKRLKFIIPLLIGFFFVFISLYRFEAEERQLIWSNIKQANLFWVSVSVVLGICSHLSRAYRWQFLLQPLGVKPRFINSFFSVMFAYLANLGVPRSGEVLRGATLANYEDVKFEQAFGTIITERVIDFLMLLLIVGVTILYQADLILNFFENKSINPLFTLILLGVLILLILLGLKLFSRSQQPLILKVKQFLEGVVQGMKTVLKMKNSLLFILHTFLIWTLYIAMFVVVKYSIPGTSDVHLSVLLVAFVFGSFAMSITNGGIGIYPLTIGATIAGFGGDAVAGESFGWIVWTAQTLLVIVVGGFSALLMPIVNKD